MKRIAATLSAVSYPFGYGLSYTTFEEGKPFFADGKVHVTVTNTGAVPGRKAVKVMDPFLCAFGKTRLLEPGESQTLVLDVRSERNPSPPVKAVADPGL